MMFDDMDELPTQSQDDGGGGAGVPISFGAGGMEGEEVDLDETELLASQTMLRKVKPEYVNYAKKAKRVDVRKLKETIWKELDIPRGAEESETESEVSRQTTCVLFSYHSTTDS